MIPRHGTAFHFACRHNRRRPVRCTRIFPAAPCISATRGPRRQQRQRCRLDHR
jgi:hypothetical protein